MALLGYIASGQTDRAGFYQSQVQRGMTALLGKIDANGLVETRSTNAVKSQALALLLFSEATATTNSQRYRTAAEKMSAGLMTLLKARQITSAMGARNLDGELWSAIALASAQRNVLEIDSNVLMQLAGKINSDGQATDLERSLAMLLAGQRLTIDQRNQA